MWDKICKQNAHKNFSGMFWEIRVKILRTPKHWPAPTPMPDGANVEKFGHLALTANNCYVGALAR